MRATAEEYAAAGSSYIAYSGRFFVDPRYLHSAPASWTGGLPAAASPIVGQGGRGSREPRVTE
jgi:hypothetical protein